MSDFDRQRHRYSQPEAWAVHRGAGLQPLTAAEASLGERVGFIRKVNAIFFVAVRDRRSFLGVAVVLDVEHHSVEINRHRDGSEPLPGLKPRASVA